MVVIFDPEGILTDTSACRFGAWKEMAREQGIAYDRVWDAQLQGLEEQAWLQSILSRGHRGYSAAERMALLTRMNDLYDDLLLQMGGSALRDGAEHMLRQLKKHGASLGAVMTDGMPGRVLNKLSVRECFQVISRREDMASQLADVQLRLRAAPADCLLITTSPASAKVARSLGMQAMLCGMGEENAALLQQILAVLPDFEKPEST